MSLLIKCAFCCFYCQIFKFFWISKILSCYWHLDINMLHAYNCLYLHCLTWPPSPLLLYTCLWLIHHSLVPALTNPTILLLTYCCGKPFLTICISYSSNLCLSISNFTTWTLFYPPPPQLFLRTASPMIPICVPKFTEPGMYNYIWITHLFFFPVNALLLFPGIQLHGNIDQYTSQAYNLITQTFRNAVNKKQEWVENVAFLYSKFMWEKFIKNLVFSYFFRGHFICDFVRFLNVLFVHDGFEEKRTYAPGTIIYNWFPDNLCILLNNFIEIQGFKLSLLVLRLSLIFQKFP